MLRRCSLIVLMAVFALAACADDDAGGVALQTLPTTAPLAGSPNPAPGFDALRAVPGTLIFTEGSALYAYPHGDSAEPVRLVENADPESLALTPGGTSLLYASLDQDRTGLVPGARDIFAVDLTTLEQTLFFQTSSGLSVLSWSPDGQWALLRVGWSRLEVARLDGTQRYELPSASSVQARWLTDGTLLLTGAPPQGGADVTISQQPVTRFDVSNGETLPLAVDPAALLDDPALLDRALAALGLALAARPDTAPQPILMRSQEGSGVCDTWHITYVETVAGEQQHDIVYSAANVYRMSVPTPLPDGALLFLETRIPGCQIANLPQVRLMILPPGGEVRVLAEDVSDGPHERGSFMTSFTTALSYATSPEGRYVVWIGGGVQAGWSSVELLDLATDTRTRLAYKQRGDGGAASFGERDVFNTVLWAGGG